jgi:tripeptidyl-peptidase I
MFTCPLGLIFLSIISTCNCAPAAATRGLKNLETFAGDRWKSPANSHVFKESMASVSTWDDLQRLDRVHGDVIHEVIFVIRLRNMERLTQILNDVADPESLNYGQHLTRAQVTNMTINVESRDAVLNYLSLSGLAVKKVTSGGEFVVAEAPVTILEKVFSTAFHHFKISSTSGHSRGFVRADAYSVPSELDIHIECVLNIVEVPFDFQSPIKTRPTVSSEPFTTSAVESSITPSKLKFYYDMDSSAEGSSESTQLVFAYKRYYSPSDLTLFQKKYETTVLGASSVGGNGECESTPDICDEGNLDMQYIMAMSPGSPTTFWSTQDDLTVWLVAVSDYVPLPLVISISYGAEEKKVTEALIVAFNNIAIKLSSMGVTIIAGSGDDGANSRLVRGSQTTQCGYVASFPASHPYVTAVGATSVRYVSEHVM